MGVPSCTPRPDTGLGPRLTRARTTRPGPASTVSAPPLAPRRSTRHRRGVGPGLASSAAPGWSYHVTAEAPRACATRPGRTRGAGGAGGGGARPGRTTRTLRGAAAARRASSSSACASPPRPRPPASLPDRHRQRRPAPRARRDLRAGARYSTSATARRIPPGAGLGGRGGRGGRRVDDVSRGRESSGLAGRTRRPPPVGGGRSRTRCTS